jgi:hypothetical protein
VARIQRQAEIEGLTERVPVMENEKERIDSLFEKNVEEQLAKVDWDKLNTAVSARLDEAKPAKASARRYATVFKIAAGVAAAAVVFIAVMVRTEKPADLPLEDSGRAVVKFIETKGSASVEIIDQNGERKENGPPEAGAAWIIIRMPEPVLADNGANGHLRDLIRLF